MHHNLEDQSFPFTTIPWNLLYDFFFIILLDIKLWTLELNDKNPKNPNILSFNLNVQSLIKLQESMASFERSIVKRKFQLWNHGGSSCEKNLLMLFQMFEFLQLLRIKVLLPLHALHNVKALKRDQIDSYMIFFYKVITNYQQFSTIACTE